MSRVELSFSDYQALREALAEGRGALQKSAEIAGDGVNQDAVNSILAKMKRASELLHVRAFPRPSLEEIS